MLVYSFPDYWKKYFKLKDLSNIHGQPNIVKICKLFKQGKRSAQTVPTTLRCGQCGNLSLLIKEASYNAIPNPAPFIHPTDSGIFAASPQIGPVTQSDPIPLTASDIATHKIAHDELLRQYIKA